MIGERWIAKDLQGSGWGLIEVLPQHSPEGTEKTQDNLCPGRDSNRVKIVTAMPTRSFLIHNRHKNIPKFLPQLKNELNSALKDNTEQTYHNSIRTKNEQNMNNCTQFLSVW